MTAAESCDAIVLSGGTAGCLPLTFQRNLRADPAGQDAQEWARLWQLPFPAVRSGHRLFQRP